VKNTDGYPGWKPNLDSPILKVARSTYRSLYGKDPEVKAIHAGLECGIIGERVPGMDMSPSDPRWKESTHPTRRSTLIPSKDTGTSFWRS